jgi:catechol 2,3-dioxygenase-like lactoylglutathione lyase family enzyme
MQGGSWPVATLAHINIRTERYSETIAFYQALLGFQPARSPVNPDLDRNTWLCDPQGNPWIHVNSLAPGETQRTADGCLDHVAFNCSDIDAFKAKLREMGVPFKEVPTLVPGAVQLNVYDPNGIKVEMTFGHELLTPLPV